MWQESCFAWGGFCEKVRMWQESTFLYASLLYDILDIVCRVYLVSGVFEQG